MKNNYKETTKPRDYLISNFNCFVAFFLHSWLHYSWFFCCLPKMPVLLPGLESAEDKKGAKFQIIRTLDQD